MKIAGYLKTNPHVTRVLYPGLPEHPGYEIMKRQARGFGGMLTFEVESTEFAVRVLNHVELIHFAESLGGTETLLTYPITQTHADVPKELLEKNGLTDRVLRLSSGCLPRRRKSRGLPAAPGRARPVRHCNTVAELERRGAAALRSGEFR